MWAASPSSKKNVCEREKPADRPRFIGIMLVKENIQVSKIYGKVKDTIKQECEDLFLQDADSDTEESA